MKITSQSMIILFSLTITSCAWFESNPYANFSIGDVNEDGPDSEATILVGDPQVISRETLINDRIRESLHIGELIKKSKDEVFEPQILRDIKVVNAFTSQLGVGFDPSIGSSFKRVEEIASLSTDIELLKLKNELKKLQEQINTDPTDSSLNPDTKKPIPDTQSTETSPKKPTHEALTGADGALSKLTATIETLLKNSADELKKKAGKSQINSSPEERFEDLNAYRARLRQRQAEINLDDVHDLLGNTLYRLQLNATILPGEIKNKYGVLDFVISGSQVNDDELKQVYINWLQSLSVRSELIKQLKPDVYENYSIKTAWKNIVTYLIKEGYAQQCENGDKTIFIAPEEEVGIIDKNITESILLQEYFITNDTSLLSKQIKTRNQALINKTNVKKCNTVTDDIGIPSKFEEKLTEKKDGKQHWKAEHIYTYQAQPSERVQRLSTLASAANSMQSAFALAATLPQYGLSIDAGAAASKAAVGMSDAIERTPLVIGYTDKKIGKPHFGYIFGPKAILQADENQLVYKQIPASHSVFADISVPGWWPSLTLQKRNVWAGNWHDDAKVLKPYNKISEIKVRLRPKMQGFDSLTDFLYSNSIPTSATDIANIERVYPNEISKCTTGNVDFIIKGKNLWRNPQVFFLGKKQAEVKVLPDMNGLWVKVDFNKLPLDTWKVTWANDENIIVWTTFGKAKVTSSKNIVDFFGSRKDCPNNIGTFKLAPDKNYYVTGITEVDLTVNITSEIPNSIWDYKIIVQVIPENGPRNGIIVSANKATKSGRKFIGKIKLEKGLIGGNDNAQLKVGLQYRTTEGGEIKQTWASKKAVFYPKVGGEKISIKTTRIASLPKRITLSLPNRMGEAYPEFKLKSAKFKLTLKQADFKKVTIPISGLRISSGTATLMLGEPTATTDLMKTFNLARCANNLKATISIKETEMEDTAIPKILSDEITLIQKNCGSS